MRLLLTAILTLAALVQITAAETHVPAGPVSGTWTLAGSPYIIEGNIYILSTSSLTIQPGVTVIQNPNCRFRIEGQLLAVGTQTDTIRFQAADTSRGSEALDFLNTNLSSQDSSRLEYCEIARGVAAPIPDPYADGGGLNILYSSRLRVSHCHLHHCRTQDVVGDSGGVGYPGTPGQSVVSGNGGAVYCQESNPVFSCNVFEYNYTGTARGGVGGPGSFNETQAGGGGVGGSGTAGNGGAIYLSGSRAVIVANIFRHNHAGNGQGGTGGRGGDAFSLNYIYVYGGSGGHGGHGIGGAGGAIYASASHAVIWNNLVFQNSAGSGIGGAGGRGGSGVGAGGYPMIYYTYAAGGSGGNGDGGYGYALYATFSSDIVNACTFTQHQLTSQGLGGVGGWDGSNTVQAPSGTGLPGIRVIAGATLTVTNSIVWGNATVSINPSAIVSYCCVEGGHEGIGNISSNPMFVNPTFQNYFLSQIAAGQPQQSPCVDAGNPASPMIIGTTRTDGVQDVGIVDMGYHYPGVQSLPQIVLDLTPHNPPVQIHPGGGSFQLDVALTYNQYFNSPIDVWTLILFPDSSVMTVLQRQNIILSPGGGTISRPNLTQFIPSGAPTGTYGYFGYVRNHTTWETLCQDSFAFMKLPGEAPPAHNLGWSVFGWEEEEIPALPTSTTLLKVVPNPFNPTTTISYQLSAFNHASLKVYDAAGRLVTTLVTGWREAGKHEVTFDGSKLASGVYFLHLQVGEFNRVQKVVMMK